MFKRNQIEEAIACVLEPGSAKLSSEMRTRLRRLLETDRGLGRSKRSRDSERSNFAFSGMAARGRGLENGFPVSGAFAFFPARLRLWNRCPQGPVVAARPPE